MIEMISYWVPVILILLALTFALGIDWPGWRLAETILVGAGIGNTFVMDMDTLRRIALTPILGGNPMMIPGIIFGLLIFFRLHPTWHWLSRYGFLWPISAGVGLSIGAVFQGNIIPNVIQAMSIPGPDMMTTLNNLIGFIIFVTVLSYFIFTRPHTGVLGVSTRIGRIFLMMGLGVCFAVLISQYYYVSLERVWSILKAFGLL